jgi:hypothetical protein
MKMIFQKIQIRRFCLIRKLRPEPVKSFYGRVTMGKYSKKAREIIASVMHLFKMEKLMAGRGGKGGVVKSRKQAIAIGISEAREAGAKVPPEIKPGE